MQKDDANYVAQVVNVGHHAPFRNVTIKRVGRRSAAAAPGWFALTLQGWMDWQKRLPPPPPASCKRRKGGKREIALPGIHLWLVFQVSFWQVIRADAPQQQHSSEIPCHMNKLMFMKQGISFRGSPGILREICCCCRRHSCYHTRRRLFFFLPQSCQQFSRKTLL
jgi:hypothetical protein